jgi:hypothetical protein
MFGRDSEGIVAQSKYYPGISLGGAEKITKHISQDSRCLGRNSNRALSERKFRALPLDQPARYKYVELHLHGVC